MTQTTSPIATDPPTTTTALATTVEAADQRSLARLVGRGSVVAGVCLALFFPILMAAWPAAGVKPDQGTNGAEMLPFITTHRALFSVTYLNGIVMHLAGILAVAGIWKLLRHRSPWVVLGTAGGLVWMAFDIAYNGLMLHTGVELGHQFASQPAIAAEQFGLMARMAESLQFTGHLGAGLWLTIAGLVAFRHGGLPRTLAAIGVVAGVLIGLSFFVPDALYPCFLLLPVWFIWSGIAITRSPELT